LLWAHATQLETPRATSNETNRSIATLFDDGLNREVVPVFPAANYNTLLARGIGQGHARLAFGMYFLYRILTAAGILILAPYYAFRGWRRADRPGALRERLGFLPQEISARSSAEGPRGTERSGSGAIWVHAVSVGEVLAAAPLIAGLKQRYPTRAVFISTTTETGQRLARERLLSADGIFYFPLDWAVAVRRALETIRPGAVIVMETEIWPNFLREARRRGVPVIFANARISERSFTRFERWRFLVGNFFARALADAAVFLAQSEEDAKRLAGMGAPEERIEITGNLKYDAEPPVLGAFGEWLCQQIQQQERWPVVIAGSVVEGEEEAVLAAYDLVQRQWRRALLVLAPRKPDRFDEAARIVGLDGWNVVRRSRLDQSLPLDENADVLVLDSIGELSALYSIADAVFVGGSLVPSGGHNILEPAWFGKPPVFGPSMENFSEMADQFLSACAGIRVNNGPMLGKVWMQLIEGAATRDRMGKAAQELSGRNRGAAAHTLVRIAEILDRKGNTA
jgi:3-deoxy-D-manno-octulosonic-acid transferase